MVSTEDARLGRRAVVEDEAPERAVRAQVEAAVVLLDLGERASRPLSYVRLGREAQLARPLRRRDVDEELDGELPVQQAAAARRRRRAGLVAAEGRAHGFIRGRAAEDVLQAPDDAALAPPQLLAAPQLRRAERRAPLDPELDERLRVEAQPRRPPRRRRVVGLELARVLVEPREPALRRVYNRSANRVV